MTYVRQENLDKHKVEFVSFISFLFGFASALVGYFISSYFKEITGSDNVGPFYLSSFLVVLLLQLNLHKLVRHFGKSGVFYLAVLANIFAIFLLVLFADSYAGAAFLMAYLVFTAVSITSLDVILESFSMDSMSGRIRGKHLTIVNLGFLLGPFLATRILERYDFVGIFVALLVLNCVILSFSFFGLRSVNHRFDQSLTVKDVLNWIIHRRNVMRIYWISVALEFFYALMVVYTSIYLREIGIEWSEVGVIFTVMLMPFVILQYPLGILADKKTGEKELLIVGILIMGLTAGSIYFLNLDSILAWGAVLFVTRIGAAIIEIMRDSYFFKRVDGRDVDTINFFRTSQPVGQILGAALSFVVLLVFPVKAIFICVGLFVLLALYPAFRLVDSKCEAELEKC